MEYIGGKQMNCFIEFLTDYYQNKLRLLAQGRSDRYENALETYKDMFLAHWKIVQYQCEKINDCPYKEECNYIKNIYKEIEEKEIEVFFDTLREVYLLWIDTKSIEAITKYEEVLEKYRLLNFRMEQNQDNIYFKGRISDQVLTKWDMFHIPFNKRYLISNQRYSLTGQPIIYLGKSVIDIVEELEVQDLSKLKVSSIQLASDMMLYDLRNNLSDDVTNISFDLFFERKGTVLRRENFFKIILSSVCSFRKKQELKGFSFCEEYVLPQLLAQVIKNKGYDGIVYYSTKKFTQLTFSNEEINREFKLRNILEQDYEYKENVALFTKIDVDRVYDKVLFDKIDISVPIDIFKIEELEFKDLERFRDNILKIEKQEKVTKSDKIVSTYNRLYNQMKIEGIKYSNTQIGKLHLYHLYSKLNEILVS